MYLLLPPSQVFQRDPSECMLFCGHAACDNGLATLVWHPLSNNVVEVSDEVKRLLLNSRYSEMRKHAMDLLCIGNLEHNCIIANMLRFEDRYCQMLALQICGNQPTVGVTNQNFGRNFFDQEMCKLASLTKVNKCFLQMAIWVQPWLNELLDAISRMYIDDVLQDAVMLTMAEITSKLGITLKFVEPNAKVKAFLVWLESDHRDQMSLVDHLQSQILTDVSDSNLDLQNLTSDKSGADISTPAHHNILPSLDSSACALSIQHIAAATADMINAVTTSGPKPLTAANICCGFGGMTLSSILAGFLSVLNVENNPVAITFTKGLVCCDDLDNLNISTLPQVHNLTVGWPCPPHTCLGRRKGWNDER